MKRKGSSFDSSRAIFSDKKSRNQTYFIQSLLNPELSGILLRFLTNQNFWGCGCTPCPTPLCLANKTLKEKHLTGSSEPTSWY